MVEVSISTISYFFPIFAFLLVFIVVYSLLKTTKILGDSEAVLLFVSFILSSFFIVETSLVEFVEVSSSWMVVGIFILFFVFLIMAFIPGLGTEELGKFLGAGKNNWFAWVLFIGIVATFIISSAYVFNWALDWNFLNDWFGNDWLKSDWFGMVLLLIIAGVVSWKIKG